MIVQNIEQQKAAKRKFNDCWRWWQILISSINEVATIIFFLAGHLKGLSAQINKNENQLAGKIKKPKTQFIKSSNIVNTGTNLNNLKLFQQECVPFYASFGSWIIMTQPLLLEKSTLIILCSFKLYLIANITTAPSRHSQRYILVCRLMQFQHICLISWTTQNR